MRFITIVNRWSITNNKDEDTENKKKKKRGYTHICLITSIYTSFYSVKYYRTCLFFLIRDKIKTENLIAKTSSSLSLLQNFIHPISSLHTVLLINLLLIDRCHKYPIPNLLACNIIPYKVSLPISWCLRVGWCIHAYASVQYTTTIALFTVPSFTMFPPSICTSRKKNRNATHWQMC